MTVAVLFLDFDGTTHPVRAPVEKLFCQLALLQDWLRRRPSVDVVISSSWREHHSVDELRGFFDEELQGRVRGVTPMLPEDSWKQFDGEPPAPKHERHTEVIRWLSENGEPGLRWAGLDDQAWLYKPNTEQLVICDGRVGLTLVELARLDEVLGFSE